MFHRNHWCGGGLYFPAPKVCLCFGPAPLNMVTYYIHEVFRVDGELGLLPQGDFQIFLHSLVTADISERIIECRVNAPTPWGYD